MIVEGTVQLRKGVEELEVLMGNCDEDMVRYRVFNTPICQFDQHSRARVGVKFTDYKVADFGDYVLYTHVYDMVEADPAFRTKVFDNLRDLENLRSLAHYKDSYNLMSRSCSYEVEQTWGSLFGQMSRRLKFCEEEFIVGLHWLLRDKLIKMGFEKAEGLLPGCDRIKKCDYSSADYLSNMFGCLFASCGRWESGTEFATFNESCSNPEMIEEQTGIVIPRSGAEIATVK
jgi:hypothetical protein